MMIFAICSWLAYSSLLLFISVRGVRLGRLSVVAFSTILAIVTSLRQPLFFLGFSKPHPQNFFDSSEWELICFANILLIAWVLITVFSYEVNSGLSRIFSPLFPASDPVPSGVSGPRGLILAVLPPFIISVGGTAWLVASFGGFANFTYAVKISKDLAGSYVIRTLGVVACILTYYAFLVSVKFDSYGKVRLPRMTLIYLSMVLMSFAATFAWGNRYTLALILLGCLAGWHIYIKRINVIALITLGVGAMALLQGLKLVRTSLVQEVTGNTQVSTSDFWINISLSLHLVEFDAFLLALRDAGELFDFRGAQDFVNGLLSWVPRSIYPAKETYHIGSWFRQVYEPWTVNGWPITTPGSWYVNFGLLGIPIGAWISGFIMRSFDGAFNNLRDSAWQAAVGPILVFFLVEGGVSTGFPQKIFLYLLPIFSINLWIAFASKRRFSTISINHSGRA